MFIELGCNNKELYRIGGFFQGRGFYLEKLLRERDEGFEREKGRRERDLEKRGGVGGG